MRPKTKLSACVGVQRKDEWTRGDVQRRERTVVTLVVEGGEAEAKGVSVGSMLVSINHTDVRNTTYKETLEMVKDGTRPMRIVFERESPKDEVIQVRRSPPSHLLIDL